MVDKANSQLEFKRVTPNSIGSMQELQTHLPKVRRNGYAWDLEENEAQIRCIAAPIWDHTGAVNSAVSITGPAVRMSMMRLRQLAPLIQDAGIKIWRKLGYQASKVGQPAFPVRKIDAAGRGVSLQVAMLQAR